MASVVFIVNGFCPKKLKPIPLDWSIQLAIYFKVWFFLSNTPFCSGVYGTICCNLMPCLVQKLINFLLTYSLPLSDLKLRIWCPDCFSTKALKAKNVLKTSLLSFKKYTQVRLEKSSMIAFNASLTIVVGNVEKVGVEIKSARVKKLKKSAKSGLFWKSRQN